MAFVAVKNLWWPEPLNQITNLSWTSTLVDASAEKVAFIGAFDHPARSTKAIRQVGFMFGTVVKAGGTGLLVSLEDVSLTTGAVQQPDGTQDQTVAIANANASFASDTWITTGNLSADRSQAHGALLAVVVQPDGSGILGSDSFNVRNLATAQTSLRGGVSHLTASWAAINVVPNIALICDDGTVGTLVPGFPVSAFVDGGSFNSGSTPDEKGMEFIAPFTGKVDRIYARMTIASNAGDLEIHVEEGGSPMSGFPVTVDANAVSINNAIRHCQIMVPEFTITAGNTYNISLRPTSANNISLADWDVATAAHFQAWPGDTSIGHNTRTDAGGWGTKSTTKRPVMALGISAIDNTPSGGGVTARVIGA